MKSSIMRQYLVYFVVGGFVGVLTVVIREVFAGLTHDSPSFYALSVSLAYSIGIVLSFTLHKLITFKSVLNRPTHRFSFVMFTLIAITGLILTSGFAVLIRYGLDLDRWLYQYAGMIAFIIASLATSVITYGLNARFSVTSKQSM